MSNKNSKRAIGMKRFFRIFFSRGWVTKICFGIIAAFVFIAIFAPVLTQYTPYEQNLRYILADRSLVERRLTLYSRQAVSYMKIAHSTPSVILSWSMIPSMSALVTP